MFWKHDIVASRVGKLHAAVSVRTSCEESTVIGVSGRSLANNAEKPAARL